MVVEVTILTMLLLGLGFESLMTSLFLWIAGLSSSGLSVVGKVRLVSFVAALLLDSMVGKWSKLRRLERWGRQEILWSCFCNR